MSQHFLFMPDDQPVSLSLPPLEVGPIRYAIGFVRVVMRPGQTLDVLGITEIRTSTRSTEKLYHLTNGERILVTTKRHLSRPDEADGVLRRLEDGSSKWITHRRIEALNSSTDKKGRDAVASEIARQWDGQFSFRAETPNRDGAVTAGNEGLRAPQLGALHAIGAHWSLYHQPATVVMPTGTGKTETMLSTLAAFVRGKLLVVVPSDVLRSQTATKFLTFGLLRRLGVLSESAPNPIVGVVTRRPHSVSDLEILEQCNVIIGTMSALAGGDAAVLAPEIARRIDTLIVDEAHHIAADGWGTFRDAFRDRKVLQFTATPFRRDGKLVDGQVIYNYPLRMAQQDQYFKPISFEPVYEIDPDEADRRIAETAIARLRADLSNNLNHLLMARCASIERATAVHAIYLELSKDLNPLLVHSELTGSDDRLGQLRSGASRVVVCVNMLGEGFDLPELKIAAIHDLHKNLAILMQFTGRFTRVAGKNIGNATVVANIADPGVSAALERLYSEDADWNECGQLLMFWKGGNTILVDFLPELVPPAFSEDEGSQAEDDLCALWGPAHPRTTQPLFDQSFACGLCDA